MEFDRQLIRDILEHLREHSDYKTVSLEYSKLPGGHSDRKVDFHLDYLHDRGFVEKDGLAAGHAAIVRLTPKGLEFLGSMDSPNPTWPGIGLDV